MNNFLKSMMPKKKRTINSDIPRPNLFTHEKTIKEAQATIETLTSEISRLSARLEECERRQRFQDQQITTLNSKIWRRN